MNVYVVTGGASGIGFGVIKELVKNTSNKIISISKGKKHIELAKKELKEFENQVEFLSADISQKDEIETIYKQISSKYDYITGLVNAAGIILPGGIEECDITDWEKTMCCNVNGTFMITKKLLPLIKKCDSQSSIVNISSVCSIRGGSSISYSTSKAATDMFTKCLAVELAKYNIRVNAVNPGVVVSNLQLSAGIVNNEEEYNEFLKNMAKMHPLGRVGTTEEIAKTVVFLLSSDSSWTTGAILSVDGGRAV